MSDLIDITGRNPRRDELLHLLENIVYYPRTEQAQIGRLAAAQIRILEDRVTALLPPLEPVQTAPTAYEFWNPETGHAIVDYGEHTHMGHLTPEKGYIKTPLFRSAATPAAIRDAALEEAAEAMAPVLRNMISRGEAAGTIRALKMQPPKEVQDALATANATIKTLRREKFELESKLRRISAAPTPSITITTEEPPQ